MKRWIKWILNAVSLIIWCRRWLYFWIADKSITEEGNMYGFEYFLLRVLHCGIPFKDRVRPLVVYYKVISVIHKGIYVPLTMQVL